MSRILLVEDEPQIRRTLAITVRAAGYEVLTAGTAADALTLARARTPDLVLLDLGLPDQDGLGVIRGLRTWSEVPIVVLSGRTGSGDTVSALDAGADDYMTKPFGTDELLARLRAVRRRAGVPEAPGPVSFGELTVDLGARPVTSSSDVEPPRLTTTEWELLQVLVGSPGRLLTHAVLTERVWGADRLRADASLRVYLARLRRKLEPDPTRPRYLLTEPGLGYRFRP